MSLGKVTRKLKRVGKTAAQFRFTSTFEYIELGCNGTWRPENLKVIWLRSHRRVQSLDLKWVPTEDRGPNGAEGRATFDPPFSVALIVTLYRDQEKATEFDDKEYKYYIENDGPSGKKILASFNCNMSEYAGIPTTRHTLDMTFKAVSKKVNSAVLGITLEGDFIKQGNTTDDDMQSTFSAVSGVSGRESLNIDDEDDDEDDDEGGRLSLNVPVVTRSPRLSRVTEEAEPQQNATQVSKSQDQLPKSAASSETQRTGVTSSVGSQKRKRVESNETYVPPPNPYLETEEGEGEVEEPSPTLAWLADASFVDSDGETVGREKLDRAEIIGLYFSANWCPPCRRFLPKLVKFYHHLKQHNKSFEILYISSDYTKQEMMKYMQEQRMPWVALAFDSVAADKLRTDYHVAAIPLFTIVNTRGVSLEESAKKPVEHASSSTAVLKLYNKWQEKLAALQSGVESSEKKGVVQKFKQVIKGDESRQLGMSIEANGQEGSSPRQVVEGKPHSKSRSHSKSTVTPELLEEKEDKIRYLEEVNMTLKQTNDDLNEEVADLKRQLQEAMTKMQVLEQSSRQLRDEKSELIANLNIRGWLLKRGVKGPTAHVWRRRYFRCDQGSKIYYYKTASDSGAPQGFIDLDKMVSVHEVSPAQQDKNHATFLVQCDGRTFQLQAHDEPTMRKWISAIEYLSAWRKKHQDIDEATS